jgi:hypothetical protein
MQKIFRTLAMRRQAIWICPIFLLTAVSGCGYPNTEPTNRRLISSLRTALSAQNQQWLAANEKLVAERHTSGAMRDDEFAAFQEIIQQAQSGDWQGAERAAVEFQRDQRPSDQEVQHNREQRK